MGGRIFAVAAVVALALVGASTAAADTTNGCPNVTGRTGPPAGLGPGYRAGEKLISAVMPPVPSNGVFPSDFAGGGQASEAKLRALLGDQFGGVWLNAWDDTWGVGVAPGPLSVDDARAAILGLVADAPADVATPGAAALRVYPEPHSWAELEAALDQTGPLLTDAGLSGIDGGFGISCQDGPFQVMFLIFDDTDAATEARIREALAPLGDKVAVVRRDGPPPRVDLGGLPIDKRIPPDSTPAPAHPTLRATVRLTKAHRLRVVVTCPSRATAPCSGTARVVANPRRGTSRTVRLPAFTALAPGSHRTLSASVSRTVRATIRRRGTKLTGRIVTANATRTRITQTLSLR
jgi:hypothetical protein